MASKAKQALTATFLKLLKEEEFSKITVTSLVESCGISRQTFYYHFNDIEEMLKWAFETETDAIIAAQEDGKWKDSAVMYIDFLNRYDPLLRSAARSDRFIMVCNYLTDSFFRYIDSYLSRQLEKKSGSKKDHEFLSQSLACTMTGLVIQEIQKEKSAYDELLKKIALGFRALPQA